MKKEDEEEKKSILNFLFARTFSFFFCLVFSAKAQEEMKNELKRKFS